MGSGKWIIGVLGWVIFGPIGGLIGFALGSLFDGAGSLHRLDADDSEQDSSQGYGGSYGAGGFNRAYRGYASNAEGQRNSFLISLLVLSTAVIRADGKYLKSELDYVQDFIRRSFGAEALPEANRILKELKDKNINIYEVGGQIRQYMNYSQRMQLFHYLVALAESDASVCQQEIDILKAIGSAIGLNSADTDSILAMFVKQTDSAYKVLEISPDATDEEVKKAYKRLAIKHHPDKVASLGADVQKAAEEKFKQVQIAYETIKKQRNMV